MYVLPASLAYLFDRSLTDIKSVGFALHSQAMEFYESKDSLEKDWDYAVTTTPFLDLIRSMFSHRAHFEFFFYGIERLPPLLDNLRNLRATKRSLPKKYVTAHSGLDDEIAIAKKKLDKVYRAAELRFLNKSYCTRKIVRLVLSEMLYESQRNKQIGGSSGESYATDLLVKFRKMQNEYNSEFLATKKILVSGETYSLASFANNATKRVSELYAKIKGLQTLADEQLKGWAFLTMTAPSKYHANPAKGQNSWDRESVKSAHDYLKECWDALGKDLKNKNISMKSGQLYGMRVVEPHKDGTPHWHMIIFYDTNLQDQLFDDEIGLFPKHFAHTDKALKTVIGDISSEKSEEFGVASAASYCFKYITKALGADFLDEYHACDENLNAQNEVDAVDKIEAWKAALGIRAYQFFGISGKSNVWHATRKIAYQAKYIKIDNDGNVTKTGINYDANDYLDDSSQICDHQRKEFLMHKELNDGISKERALQLKAGFHAVLDRSTAGDFAGFLRACDEYEVELIKETSTNRYGDVVKKVVGINIGTWVHLFRSYTVATDFRDDDIYIDDYEYFSEYEIIL